MKENGITPNRIKVTELLLDSGIRVLVKPLVPYSRFSVSHKASEKYPDPDPKDFEERIPDSKSPGATIPVDDPANSRRDEFIKLQQTAQRLRTQHLLEFVIDECVIFPDFADRNELIAHFDDQRKRLSKYMDLPKGDWEATLYHCILGSEDDIAFINAVTRSEIELIEDEPTEGEIHAAWRLFRPAISWAKHSRITKYAPMLQEIKNIRNKVSSDS